MNGTKRCKGKRHQVLKRQSNGGNWSISEIVDVQLNSVYSSKNFCESATKAWASPENQDENAENKSPIDLEDGCDLYKNPFSCCQLRDFFKEGDFLLQLKNELLALSFREKSNDLYQFLQSEDLKKVQTTAVSALKKFLYGDFRRWLISVTGIPLNSTVDMSCAQYNYTGNLKIDLYATLVQHRFLYFWIQMSFCAMMTSWRDAGSPTSFTWSTKAGKNATGDLLIYSQWIRTTSQDQSIPLWSRSGTVSPFLPSPRLHSTRLPKWWPKTSAGYRLVDGFTENRSWGLRRL